MGRYKFKTVEDAIELCRSLGNNNAIIALTESDEAMKKMNESLQCRVYEGGFEGMLAYGTI